MMSVKNLKNNQVTDEGSPMEYYVTASIVVSIFEQFVKV